MRSKGRANLARQLPGNVDRQAFATEFIKDQKEPQRPAITRSSMNEVIAPHLLLEGRAKPKAPAIVEPQTAAFRLFRRYSQPLATPKTFDPLEIHLQTFLTKQRCHPSVAVPTEGRRPIDQPCHQTRLIISQESGDRDAGCRRGASASEADCGVEDGPAPDKRAARRPSPDLSPIERGPRSATSGEAQWFSECASFRIALSSDRSATNFFSRAFSLSRSFIHLA